MSDNKIDKLQGVLLVDPEYLDNKKVRNDLDKVEIFNDASGSTNNKEKKRIELKFESLHREF